MRAGMTEAQLDELRWLGMDWDEGPGVGGAHAPYVQSLRGDLHHHALERLAAGGHLFACGCSRREIAAAASAPHGPGDDGPRYPGTCRARVITSLSEAGHAALRFRVEPGEIRFHDLVHGECSADPHAEVGDFVVRRRDGVPSYQLAVAADDIEMRVTHVLRGDDLLSSTARQLLLYHALRGQPPVWAHVPLLLSPAGERLAKRHGGFTIAQLRAAGRQPEEVVGYLAHSAGLRARVEPTELRELVEGFSLERLRRGPGRVEAGWGLPDRA
jgi:glutamyl-tRNA synthetase